MPLHEDHSSLCIYRFWAEWPREVDHRKAPYLHQQAT